MSSNDGSIGRLQERREEIKALHKRMFGPLEEEARARAASASKVDTNGHSPQLGDTEIIERAGRAQNGGKFRALWSGDTAGYSSHSEADLALADLLAFWTQDASQIERIFEGSGLARGKWNKRADYRRWTIDKALSGVREYFGSRNGHSKIGHHNGTQLYNGRTKADADGVIEPDEGPPGKWPADPEFEPSDGGEPCTDLGNSERLVRYFGELIRYCPVIGWLAWDGRRFLRDDGRVIHFAKLTARGIYFEAGRAATEDRRKELSKHAIRTEAVQRLAAMVKLAESAPPVRIERVDLDADPYLFNCANGTLDLRTGELRGHSPSNLITRLAPVEYDRAARSEMWEAYLQSTFAGREELIGFIQRAAGYALSGLTVEECMFMLWGDGRNGKGTLVDALTHVMGDYIRSAPMETFMRRNNESIPNDLAMLDGARLVATSEVEKGKQLAEARMKQLTGGDAITARFLHREFFDYVPVYKIFMAVNDKPRISGDDTGIWSRIHLIPFEVTFFRDEEAGVPKKDPHLKLKLRGETAGILRWAVEGCLEWQRTGLRPPQEVLAATSEYRIEMDALAGFLGECCEVLEGIEELGDEEVVAAGWYVSAKELYAAYVKWAEGGHERAMTKKSCGLRLGKKGFVSKPVGANVACWWGLRLREEWRILGV